MAEAIRTGEMHQLKEIMKNSTEYGMQTFDQALYDLYEEGIINYTQTLAHADSANDVRLMIKLHSNDAKKPLNEGVLEGITLDL
jgi:twitching motility protein PilU